jgi:AhpD family alkylhydroperoxidase
MQKRINIKTLEPKSYQGMFILEEYIRNSQINPMHRGLIKIRVSQINGCAYCIQMHTTEARKAGESEQRIYALSAWRESPLFSEEERALLALTEEVTLISEGGVSDETYAQALRHFDENVLAQTIMQIVAINAWNRIAISTHMIYKEN